MNASNLSTGIVASARLGSGTANASTYLRGDGTWAPIPAGADNLGNHIATTTLRSDTNNTDDLGTSGVRWRNGWFSNTVTASSFAGSGASLTSLNASNLSTGIVASARLGSGTANASTYLRGNGTWATLPAGADNLGNHIATTSLNLSGNRINNLATPSSDSDAATKAYVDTAVAGAGGGGTIRESTPHTYLAQQTWTHGLGSRPRRFGVYLQAKTNNNGFVIGERINFTTLDGDGGRQAVVSANSTTMTFRIRSEVYANPANASGAFLVNSTDWSVVFWAETGPVEVGGSSESTLSCTAELQTWYNCAASTTPTTHGTTQTVYDTTGPPDEYTGRSDFQCMDGVWYPAGNTNCFFGGGR